MSSALIRDVFYIDMESLFDLRLSVLYRLAPEAVGELDIPAYYERDRDDFEALTNGKVLQADYAEAYANKTMDDVKNSMVTNIIHTLKDAVEKIMKGILPGEGRGWPIIHIDTFGYEIDPVDGEELKDCLMAFINPCVDVTLVSIGPARLTPERVKSDYGVVVMYDLDKWMHHHHKALETVKMPDISFLSPALYRGEKPTDEKALLTQVGEVEMSPFEVLEFFGAEMAAISMVEPYFFSILNLSELKEAAEAMETPSTEETA